MTITLIGQRLKPLAHHSGRNKMRRMAVEEGTGKLNVGKGETDLSLPNFKQASPSQVRQDNVLLHPGATEKTVLNIR